MTETKALRMKLKAFLSRVYRRGGETSGQRPLHHTLFVEVLLDIVHFLVLSQLHPLHFLMNVFVNQL